MSNMKKRAKSKDDSIHVTDEVFNTSSHLVGTIFSIVGTVFLIVKSSIMAKGFHIVSFSVYGATLILVFLSSTLHHGINSTKKTEGIFKLLDYFAIFPLIAGTFTPFCLVTLRTPIGWAIFGIVWGLAVIGITIKAVFPKIPKWVTNTIYLSMGWIGLILAIPLFRVIGFIPILLIAIGGVFYTVGSVIFYIEKPNIVKGKFGFHEIWHIFVIFGAFTHYIVMYFFILKH